MRLLLVSDSPGLYSGLARVVRELASRFVEEGHEVFVAGWAHAVAPPREYPYQVFPVLKDQPATLLPALEKLTPEIVLAIGDPWDFTWLAAIRTTHPHLRFRLIGYLNVEAAAPPMTYEQVLDGFDAIATTSEFGARQLGRPSISAVHHGVSREDFPARPKPARAFGLDLDRIFVVLLNAQNIQRKNLATALGGFADFARSHEGTLCYVNSKAIPEDPDPDGVNLHELVLREGINERVMFNPQNLGPRQTVSDAHLASIYSMADALLITSFSEGFGLPVLEAMSTRTIVVAPDAYSMTELVGQDRGFLYPPAATIRIPVGDVVIVSREIVARQLEQVYWNWREDRLTPILDRAEQWVEAKTWDVTHRELSKLFLRPRMHRADGQRIDPYLRRAARRVAGAHPTAFGVLKMGGIGDMLQTSVVVRAAARKYDRPAIVFCNAGAEVFEAMPEVVEVVSLSRPQTQAEALRSVVDQFSLFFDVRYVSRAYGLDPTRLGLRYGWFYDAWTESCARLETLGLHATQIMLESLGLAEAAEEGIRPIFLARESGALPPVPYVCVAPGVGAIGRLKSYPDLAWGRVLAGLSQLGLTPVQIGGMSDGLLPAVIDGRTDSLARTATLIEAAAGVVAVEGGMAHLAAAVGKPAVVIFGPTPMGVFGYPWNANLSTQECPACWWNTPTWIEERCAIAAPLCVNFPPPALVLAALEKCLTLPADETLPTVINLGD